jgi:hypothetical protein
MVVSLSDTVRYWVGETASGTAPYFTSTEAGAADTARRGWTRILPRYHHAAPPAAAASAGGAHEVYREEGIEGVFSDYLPGFDRATLVAAVEDGNVNLATGARHAPLRLWIVGRRKLAWQAAQPEGRALTTTRNRFNALLAMYWALAHLDDLRQTFGLAPTRRRRSWRRLEERLSRRRARTVTTRSPNTRRAW